LRSAAASRTSPARDRRCTLSPRTASARTWSGIADGVDVGFRLGRTPGSVAASLLAIDPKVRLLRGTSSVLSVGIPTGIAWDEGADITYRGAFLVPTLYLSMDVSPSTELIASPKLHLLFERDHDARTAWGVTLAARFTEPERRWAVQPELGLTRIDDATLLLVGFSVSAVN
jgi:hypothetical protein